MIFNDRFPLCRQYDAMDCGPACLKMICAHYGKEYSLQFLRQKCGVSREGVSLQNLREAAQSLGFDTRAVLADFGYLAEDACLPCIAHWEEEHFVVIYKIDPQYVYIADPAFGKRKLNYRDFLSRWQNQGQDQGYLLLMEAAEKFGTVDEPGPSGRQTIGLLQRLKPYSGLLIQLALAMLAGSLIQLLLPFLTQWIVDKGIGNRDLHMLQLVLAGQLILILSRTVVAYIRGWVLFFVSMPLNISLVYDFLIKLAQLPLAFFDTRMLGDTLQRIADHRRLEQFLTHYVLGLALTTVNLIVFGSVLFIYNRPIFLVFLAGTLIYLIWIRIFLARRREIDFVLFRQQAANQQQVIQFIQGMQELRLNNGEEQKIVEWLKTQKALLATHKKSLSLSQNQQAGCSLLQETQNIFITFLAARAVIQEDITLGMMLAIQFILGQLNGPVEQLVEFTAAAQDAAISFERTEEVHRLQNEEHNQILPGMIPRQANISLEKLCFQYGGSNNQWVLQDVSLTIPWGQTTAIVGASGSGKTTLLKLLLGVYRPVGGQIRIGNFSLDEISLREWRNCCGSVMQGGYLFSGTVGQNIALGEQQPDEKRLREAAAVANIHDFFVALPLGYKTRIGPDGLGLSQGQSQRLLIARAVYRNPEYLFLDEATNSLDAANEAAILQNLASCLPGRTLVFVAHRLSTVRNADKIVVIEQGRVAETGTHEELIRQNGIYYDLVKNQMSQEPC